MILVGAAVLVGSVGLVAPAQAATARTVSLSAATATPYAGGTVTLSGKLTRSPKGAVVRIQRRSGTSWIAAGRTSTTTTSGAYSLKVTLPSTPATYTYRAWAPATRKLARAFSRNLSVTALRRTSATLGASPQVLTAGETSTLNGTVSPYVPGTPVSVQRLSGTSWITVGTPALSDIGGYTMTVTPTSTTSYRALVPRTGLNSGAVSPTRVVQVNPVPAPTITTSTLPDATRGAAYTAPLAKTGKAGTWSIQNLPAGLSIDAGTGVISGTTYAAVGNYAVYPTFTETSTGRSVLKALALHIGGVPLTITNDPTLPDGHREAPYSVTFTKVGGPGTWGAVQIPNGFTLDPATGTLTGTPTVAGIYAVYISFTETAGTSVTQVFSLTVVQPKITTTSIPAAVTGTPYSFQFAKTGLDGTWETNAVLPDGFTLSTSGLLTGNPATTGDYGFQVTFTETSTGAFSKYGYILHIEAPGSPTITTTSLPAGAVGTPYSATLAATPAGGLWSVTAGSLPAGLALNPTSGAITGTPSVAEDAYFIVTYTNGATKNTKVLGIQVAPAT